MTVLVLGDQLLREIGPVADRPDERILMIEATAFARRHPYHPHKLTLVFSAMRHFRDELRAEGRTVEYRRVERFGDALAEHFEEYPSDDLVAMRPASYGATDRLAELVADQVGQLELVENPSYICSRDEFDAWAADRRFPYRHVDFYRYIRRKTGYLMEEDEPIGGNWSYDEQNREFPVGEIDPPEPPSFPPDDITSKVIDWVAETFDGGYEQPPYGGDWADPAPFVWPVTREDALSALESFVDERLANFGPYQDAMLTGEWAMYHALLSPVLNLGLLRPAEVIEIAIDRGLSDPNVPINSVEGFVRQVLGWREFVRHAYRASMPDLAGANQLDANEDLPAFYWTGETNMACLAEVIDDVRKRGYSHHIQRLMVLSNFALLYGVEPRQLDRWFRAGYVDAYHWVTTPNVVEMGLYGAGVFASKPYAASANYIDRMSDYCSGCPFDPGETIGEDACPFNALYWEFLDRNEERLRKGGRMALVFSHLDDKDHEAIRDRAETVTQAIVGGEL